MRGISATRSRSSAKRSHRSTSRRTATPCVSSRRRSGQGLSRRSGTSQPRERPEGMRLTLLCVVLLLGSSCGSLSGGGSGSGALKSGNPSTSPTAGGSPPSCTAVIDYVDFVRFGKIFYSASYSILGRPITDVDLGAERFRVKNTVSLTTCDPYYRPVDGDAAFVPAGESVFAVKGYAPTFRLAARHNNMLVLYEAESNPAARRGADLMDIEGRVKSIALLDQKTGRTAVSRISDRSRVESLVRVIANASIDPS